MSKALKILIFFVIAGVFLRYTVGSIILQRDPVAQDFPLTQVWKRDLREPVVGLSQPDGEILLVRTSTSLNALVTSTGDVVWQQELSWQADPKPPVTHNGVIYVTDGNFLWALYEKNGLVLWKSPTTYSASWVTDASRDIVIVNQVGVDILIFDSTKGTLLWRTPVCRGFVHAVTDNENVYIPCDGLKALEAQSGTVTWQVDVGNITDIGYSEGVVYYLSNSIEAYDVYRQTELWSTSISKAGFEQLHVASTYLFYRDTQKVCLLELNNGDLKWCEGVKYPQDPAVVGNNVYIFDGQLKTIRALQISEGNTVGTLTLSNFNYLIIDRPLMVASNQVLYFAAGKSIYAYTN